MQEFLSLGLSMSKIYYYGHVHKSQNVLSFFLSIDVTRPYGNTIFSALATEDDSKHLEIYLYVKEKQFLCSFIGLKKYLLYTQYF